MPVKFSAGPLAEGCEPLRVMLSAGAPPPEVAGETPASADAPFGLAWAMAIPSSGSESNVAARSFMFILRWGDGWLLHP
ncbi:hypothetical protein D187_007896 [Cystobacter fuscus DSM 2262]|uniref:Uncharacterized protein n=1 Tax=Cystobacter fuscus (strain ATCC 25194 / DSM 2262 / NBRC 100088 / M29) TaxID=1242864 RepID=S9Q5F7_CYSF2|nr:hypothetical protein D187_007896 [Cystobacter fuscus DSM 2262]